MDPTSQLSQLASFSAVEQQVQTNTTLTSLLNTTMITQAESAVGKTVALGRRLGQRHDLLGDDQFQRIDGHPDQRPERSRHGESGRSPSP